VSTACYNLGHTLEQTGDLHAAARALVQGIVAFQRVERDVGPHDTQRVLLFNEQHTTYMRLQSVLLGLGQPEWALGVAAQAKARALTHRLGAADAVPAAAARGAYAELCCAWWAEVQKQARGEAAAAPCGGSALRVLEYSLLFGDRLAIWVLSGAGELLGSATVPTTAYRRDAVGRVVFEDGLARMEACCGAQTLLAAARQGMNVRGRDAIAGGSADYTKEHEFQLAEAGSKDGEALERGNKCKFCHLKLHLCACKTTKKKTTAADDEARERALLRELYAALLAPVEAALAGAEEVLIVPHKELFEVPWAALIDAHGRFLIERYVLRVAPSLRVAHQAAFSMKEAAKGPGHVLLVGNPLPTPPQFSSLPSAEAEINAVEDILNRAEVRVKKEHVFRSDRRPRATKGRVKRALEGAGWVHFACHADLDTNSLVLAIPERDDLDADRAANEAKRLDASLAEFVDSGLLKQHNQQLINDASKFRAALTSLRMDEVQGSEYEAGVQLGTGATVLLSACNTARGPITADGVLGMARGCLMAGAAAAVVSLWSVDDLSTATLMEQMYRHLVEGLTVPQALRLAMLRLARRPTPENALQSEEPSSEDGWRVEWKRPMYWAGFLVMGASTRLPRGCVRPNHLATL